MKFADFAGQKEAKMALILNAVEPRCGGVLFLGERGCGKSTLARMFPDLLPAGIPFIELPLNATEEGVLGGIDMERTLRDGRRVFQPGVLSCVHRGFLHIDDAHLLSDEILALVLEAQGRGENIIEKEGLQYRHPAQFQIIAGMSSVEDSLSAHFLDRFGMAVVFQKIADPGFRKEIIRKSSPALFAADPAERSDDADLSKRIGKARARLAAVIVTPEVELHIVDCCLQERIAGHRGDLFLYCAARAHAAFHGKDAVDISDVDAVKALVLAHRRRQLPPEEQQEQTESQKTSKHADNNPSSSQPPLPNDGRQKSSARDESDSGKDASSREKESAPLEEVFRIGETFKIRRLHYARDRCKRGSSGRKMRSLSLDKRGRYIGSRERGYQKDIAIDATIRAAAPWQRARGAGERFLVCREDLRYKQRETKIGHLAVFVVDGSGSMGVQRRMLETKGAIQSLLLDSYQKRDKVAMIVFRGDRAEIVLAPTSSVAWASKCLSMIPTGGKTPLSAGLLCAHELIRKMALREGEMRFLMVLLTDGKANQAMTEAAPMEEASLAAARLRSLPATDFLVVDTEKQAGFIKTGRARLVAEQLAAQYFPLDALKSDSLAVLVKSRIRMVDGF